MPISHNHRPYEYPDYVSALPADELIKMGSMKQDMYSQGVQSAQSYMDNMARLGIDLVKDSDKEYFSNEMTKLTEAINGQARGVDFSNLSQVRSLMNVGKPLETDKNLLNALKGTKEFRRRQEEMSSTDPKYRSASNDWYYMKDAAEWLNDGKVGSDLSYKEYTPYVDINAKLEAVISKLQPDIYTNIDNDHNGHITLEEVKTISDLRLRDAVLASLDGKERGQLMIDASYDLHSMGKEAAQKVAINGTTERLKATDQAIVSLNMEMKQLQDAMDSVANPQLKLEYQKEIDRRRGMLKNQVVAKQRFQEELDSYSDVNTMDISKYYPYYFREYLTSQTSAWSYQQSSKKVETDQTFLEALKFNNQYSLDRAKARDAMNLEAARGANDLEVAKVKAKSEAAGKEREGKPYQIYTNSRFGQDVIPKLKLGSNGTPEITKHLGGTVRDALSRWSDENNWSGSDRASIRSGSFTGNYQQQEEALEDFRWHVIEPIKKNLNDLTGNDKISVQIEDPTTSETSTHIISVEDFYNLPPSILLGVRDISRDKPTIKEKEDLK